LIRFGRYWRNSPRAGSPFGWRRTNSSTPVSSFLVEPQTAHVKGRDGIEASANVTFVWTIRDGAIERVVMYQDRKDALEAVGLSEQDAHADS
jgi:ketosteroid isomerase-like protein